MSPFGWMPPLLLLGLLAAAAVKGSAQADCARTCVARHCGDFTRIRYGRWCGEGHAGCPETEPCDGLDAACQTHDACVKEASTQERKDACGDAFVANLTAFVAGGGKGYLEEIAANLPDDMKPERSCYPAAVVETLSAGVQRARTLAAFGGGKKKNKASAGQRRAAEDAAAPGRNEDDARAQGAVSGDVPTPQPPPNARRGGVSISHDEL